MLRTRTCSWVWVPTLLSGFIQVQASVRALVLFPHANARPRAATAARAAAAPTATWSLGRRRACRPAGCNAAATLAWISATPRKKATGTFSKKKKGYGRQHEGGSRVERRRRRCFREVIAPAEGLSERKADDNRGEGTEAVHWGLIHFLARLITQDETRCY